jgi:hypothetical protein
MANLSVWEKVKFENLFDMRDGYVLDFSNASFRRFIIDAVGVDIYQDRYNYSSGSKANRLRAFFEKENDVLVGKLLLKLLEHWKTKKTIDNSEVGDSDQTLFKECYEIATRLTGEEGTISSDVDSSGINVNGAVVNYVTGTKFTFPSSLARSDLNPKSDLHKKVFISYRRDDSADVSGRIYDRLVQFFDKECVFKDVDSIPLGYDFREILDNAVKECDVLLAIIGRQWLDLRNADGERRIDSKDDFVKIEIQSALKRKIPVIPILVQGTLMPSENDLPIELKELAYRNGISVRSDPDFHSDMNRLIGKLESLP